MKSISRDGARRGVPSNAGRIAPRRRAARADGRRRWAAFVVGSALAIVALAVALVGVRQPTPAVAQAVGPCKVYDAGVHTFEVPAGVTQIEATVLGAQGGDVDGANPPFGDGGLGGGASGVVIPVTPGESLEIVVGGAGLNSSGAQSPAPPGGSPGGGGDGALGSAHTSATGGGASSIRRGAQSLIIVGGGGGGAHGGSGGAGGLTGTDGTKNAGSVAGTTPGLSGGNGGAGGDGNPAIHDGGDGAAGQGGAGGGAASPLPVDGGGGGGGGAVGGGAGGGGPGNGATGGGGGSSFDATGTASFQTGVREGDGQVTLAYNCAAPAPRCTVATFDTAGVHTFQVPAWVTEIEPTVFGAQGGDVLPDTDPLSGDGGLGAGVVDLAIPVTPGESLEIVVGGAGADASGGGAPAPPGGSPGGGGAGAVGSAFTSASGGGASEIRRGTQALVIAGGGGGAAYGGGGGQGGGIGTNGTRLSGAAAVTGGRAGGTGGAGGAGTTAIHNGQDGTAGQGGTGGASEATPPSAAGGGGGGGAFGGGGGGGATGSLPSGSLAGGGGGGSSSHVAGPATYQTGAREGAGLVTIGYPCAPPAAGNVSIDKQASDGRVTVGDTVTYKLVARNNGAGQADSVVVEDSVPSRLDVHTASTTQGHCSVTGNRVRCGIGSLAAGQQATVTIRTVATGAGQTTNTGIVLADRCPAAQCDNDPASVTIDEPRLRVAKTAATTRVRAGDTLTYRIRVTNPSERSVRNVRTCDLLPAGLVPVSSTPKANVREGRYCWTAQRIGAGRSKSYRLTVRALPGAGGRAVNRATTSSPGARGTARGARAVRVLGERAAGGGVTG